MTAPSNPLRSVESLLTETFTAPRDIWWKQTQWDVAVVRETLARLYRLNRAERARVMHPTGKAGAVGILYRKTLKDTGPMAAGPQEAA